MFGLQRTIVYKLLMKHRLCYIVNMDSLCIWVKIILTIQWGSVDTNAMQYSKQDERQILYGEIQCRFKRIVKKRPKCTSPSANCYHSTKVSPKDLWCINVGPFLFLCFSRPERQSDSSKSSMHHQHHHSHHFPHRQHPSTIYQQHHVRQASQATTAPSIDDQTEQKDWLHGVHL